MEMDQGGRARPRIGISHISVRFVAEGNESTGMLRDVSRQGLYVRASHLPRPGAVIAVQFEGPFGDLVDVRGEVRWNTDSNGTRPSGFGVLLHEPSREFRSFVGWALSQSEKEDEDPAL